MKNILLILGLIIVVNAAAQTAQKDTKPNVLFISVDDLNDWVGGFASHPQAHTPNLDRLFSKGVLFTNAHASQAVCTASRNSLLSGLHPTSTGWYQSTKEMRATYDEVMGTHKMMPQYFKDNGYNTYAAGKVFHDGITDYPDKKALFWTESAPEYWNDMEPHILDAGNGYGGRMFYPFPKDGGQMVQLYGKDKVFLKKHGNFHSLCGGPLDKNDIPKEGMYDEQTAKWAVEKLNTKMDKPFFMAVGFIRPHVPYTAPKEFFDLYDPSKIELPIIPENEMEDIPMMGKSIAYGYSPQGEWADVMKREGTLRELVHAYLACVSFVDAQIGQVLDALEKSDHAKNTIIVLWSDHGQHIGEKRHFRKMALWEESTKVPLFFSVPGMSNEGKKCESAVSLLDLYPSLVELCDLPKLSKLEGNSIVPLIKKPSLKWDKPVLSSWLYKNFAVRSNEWRYIQYRDGSEELYNHYKDPNEYHNLAINGKNKNIIAKLKKYIPSTVALPAGTTKWEGDELDERIKGWRENNAIPDWLEY